MPLKDTIFPHIVSAETSFLDLEIVANSNIFSTYKINLLFAAETIPFPPDKAPKWGANLI